MDNHTDGSFAWNKHFKDVFVAYCYVAEKYVHNKQDAKDIVMECIKKILENQHFEYRDIAAVKRYLSTAVKNRCIDFQRQRQTNGKHTLPQPPELLDSSPINIEEYEVEMAILYQQIKAEISKLPTRTRQILELRFYHNQSTLEISQTLGIARRTVQNMLTKGVAKLRKVLGNLSIFQPGEFDE